MSPKGRVVGPLRNGRTSWLKNMGVILAAYKSWGDPSKKWASNLFLALEVAEVNYFCWMVFETFQRFIVFPKGFISNQQFQRTIRLPGWLAGSWNESLKTLWISYLYKYVLVIPQKFILLGRLGWLKVLQKMSSQICWLCPFPVTYSHHQDDEHTFLVSRMTN